MLIQWLLTFHRQAYISLSPKCQNFFHRWEKTQFLFYCHKTSAIPTVYFSTCSCPVMSLVLTFANRGISAICYNFNWWKSHRGIFHYVLLSSTYLKCFNSLFLIFFPYWNLAYWKYEPTTKNEITSFGLQEKHSKVKRVKNLQTSLK